MKRILLRFAVQALLLIIGFIGGRVFQHAKNGYRYTVLEQKEYSSTLGPVQWSCVTESVGVPFLDTEKTIISFANRTIYKAQRDFQERTPFAQNIQVSDKSISWDDGGFQFHLTVEPVKNSKPTSPMNGSHQVRSGTNSTSSAVGTNH